MILSSGNPIWRVTEGKTGGKKTGEGGRAKAVCRAAAMGIEQDDRVPPLSLRPWQVQGASDPTAPWSLALKNWVTAFMVHLAGVRKGMSFINNRPKGKQLTWSELKCQRIEAKRLNMNYSLLG